MNKNQNPQLFRVSLKALLKNNKGEYLILKAKSNNWFKGYWDLPGGRINKDEVNVDFHILIDREIKEETGNIKYKLRPDPVSLSNFEFPSKNSTFYILFEAKYISGEIKTSDEHSGYKWQKLDRNNIKKLFHPSLVKIMQNYFKWNK